MRFPSEFCLSAIINTHSGEKVKVCKNLFSPTQGNQYELLLALVTYKCIASRVEEFVRTGIVFLVHTYNPTFF